MLQSTGLSVSGSAAAAAVGYDDDDGGGGDCSDGDSGSGDLLMPKQTFFTTLVKYVQSMQIFLCDRH